MKNKLLRKLLIFCILTSFILTTPVSAAAGITLDGSFDDWDGQPCISDPLGDASSASNDLTTFCFVSDQEAELAYFMIERDKETNKPLTSIILIDNNNDGDYTDPEDRAIEVVYNANQNSTKVDVDIFDGTGALISTVATGANWGQTGSDGASRVELGASFADLGFAPGATVAVSMYVISMQGNTVDDGSAEIQWTPADALGPVLLAGILLAASLGLAYLKTRKATPKD
ncbi:hypothetical protein KQH61_05455 [bacterium]|nr:hypothetical protein [bacterium]MCB2179348.1 hypothetical protein [bacterium]